MKNKRKRAACLLLAVLCVIQLFVIFSVSATAAGETASVSNVLDDLRRDPDFKVEDYPENPEDYSLQVITIAESDARELLVYVYQPAAATTPLTATSINISQSHKAIQFHNYTLTLLNSDGVFQKYVVNDFVVQNQSVRYYEITNIYRLPRFEGEESTGYDDGNVVNELSNPVGRGYQFTGYADGNTSLVVEDIDFIRVTDKYVGFMRYPAQDFPWIFDWLFLEDEVDVHFVAFSANRKIDQLLEADVYYTQQSVKRTEQALWFDDEFEFGERKSEYAYLKFDQSMDYTGDCWYSHDYQWKTIEKASDFLVSEQTSKVYKHTAFNSTVESTIDEDAKGFIGSKTWVLRFACTPYEHDSETVGEGANSNAVYKYSIVGEVSILRLAFITDGVYYNLGVVDNKQSGKLSPDNTYQQITDFNAEWFEKILAVLLFIVVLAIFIPLVSPILGFLFKLIVKGFGLLFKILFKILFLPIKLIWRFLFPKKR